MNLIRLTLISFAFLFISFPILNAQLYINELVAKNDGTISDEFDEYNDWIEIYNAGNSAIDLAGYYFSDDPADLTLWQIPSTDASKTTVPANGYLIIWADDDTEQGPHHLGFKLSASGGEVLLIESNGSSIVDQVTFSTLGADVSYGRVTDGASNFQIYNTPTPGVSNATAPIPTYDAFITAQIISANDDAEETAPGFLALNDPELRIADDWSNQQVGLRFTSLDIPQGAKIKSAFIQFQTANTFESEGDCNLTIHGDDADDSAPFMPIDFNISSRSKTSASVDWEVFDWITPEEAGFFQQTPSLKSIVQEIVDRPNWSPNNDMSFILTGTGKRVPYAYDSDPQKAAKLILRVELPSSQLPLAPNQLFINEVAARGTDHLDETGTPEDWIELYNATFSNIPVGGLFLTDDLDNLTKWAIALKTSIPTGGFMTIWADKDPEEGGLHTNFNLSGAGETIALVQKQGNSLVILDSITLPETPFKASYGRQTDGNSDWITFGEITPNASNNGAKRWLAKPTISLASGVYSGTQSISISHPDAGATVRYTTDGSIPTSSSTAYSFPFSINSSQGIRAAAFRSGFEPSLPATHSYLFNIDNDLASLVITTDPDNFFDDEIGIYVTGTNGIVGFCEAQPNNYAQDWERPVNLTLIEKDGAVGFNVDAGVKIGGNCSRQYPLKSLNVYLREKVYGDQDINYQLYPERSITNYSRLKIRNSGQDFLRMNFRDGALHTLLSGKVDVELQGMKQVAVYLNGEFWGLHNIRELYNDEYFETIYDIKKDEIDVLKNPMMSWMEIKVGDAYTYRDLFAFFESNDMSSSTAYDYAASQIDINQFTNYWISQIYYANYDWPANNQTVWREKKADAKWRWCVQDNDGSTNNGLNAKSNPDFNTFINVMDAQSNVHPNHSSSTLFLRKLLENNDFKNEYLQRTCSFIELLFNEERVTHITDSLKANIEPLMGDHIDKWQSGNAGGGSLFAWNAWIDSFNEFFEVRPNVMRGHLDDFFNLNGTYNLTVNYDQDTRGDVFVNSNQMTIPYNYVGQYFNDIPLMVTVIPKSGYTFSHWLETGETNPTIAFNANTDSELTPIFDQIVATEDLENNVDFAVYPNPNSGFFTVDLTLNQRSDVNISVYNMLGQTVTSELVQANDELQHPINLKGIVEGIYIVEVSTNFGKTSKKIMIR